MKNSIIKTLNFDECYGCHACVQICTRGAISMIPNNDGFLYPVVDENKCIECGLCEKVCPTKKANIQKLFHHKLDTVYAAWNHNLAERIQSTSGGLFYVLASKIIKDGGVVYGVSYDPELLAFHKRVETFEGLKDFRGSKYLQSNTKDTFNSVKADLKNGIQVLYSGTPCQIAALRLFLRKDYDNLFTVDLVCHGVPSPLIFKEHIKYIEESSKSKLVDFKFRAKKNSGWRSYVKYVYNKGNAKYVSVGMDFYSHFFHKAYLNRNSCFSCSFSSPQRIGDITLSDFWGAEKYSKTLRKERKYGFNLVMLNTNKALSLFNEIRGYIDTLELPFEYAYKGDIRLRNTELKPDFRDKFYELYHEKGYPYMAEKYKHKSNLFNKCIPTFIKNIIREIQSWL